MDSRYGTFLDSYNNGNQYFDKLAQGFFSKIETDVSAIVSGDDTPLTDKFNKVNNAISDKGKNSYDKLTTIVSILDDPAITTNVKYKKNIASIVYNLVDVASASEDSLLIDKTYNIASQVVPGV